MENTYSIEQMMAARLPDLYLTRFVSLDMALHPDVELRMPVDDVKSFFVEKNCLPHLRKESLSEDGNYVLVVDVYSAGDGKWNCSRGRVFLAESDREHPIADIKRNYSSFPFLFTRLNSKDFFICGEDYQGQTFVDLSTGEMKSVLSEGSDDGAGFCWAEMELMGDGITLLVTGCHWGCQYEYRFFDVTNPLKDGWPEIPLPEGANALLNHERTSVLQDADGYFTWSENMFFFKETGQSEHELDRISELLTTSREKARHLGTDMSAFDAALIEHDSKYGNPEENPEKWESRPEQWKRLHRYVNKIVLACVWKSDRFLMEQKSAENRMHNIKEREKEWIKNDFLLSVLTKAHEEIVLDKVQISYPSLVQKWEGELNDAFIGVVIPSLDKNRTAFLVWGVHSGHIELRTWKRGENPSSVFISDSVDGLLDAWDVGVHWVNGVENPVKYEERQCFVALKTDDEYGYCELEGTRDSFCFALGYAMGIQSSMQPQVRQSFQFQIRRTQSKAPFVHMSHLTRDQRKRL